MARGVWSLPVALVTGVLAAHQLSSQPPYWLIIPTAFLGLVFLPWRRTRWLAIFLMAGCWALWHFGQMLDDRLDSSLSGSDMVIEGVVSGIPVVYPDYTRFRFKPAPGAAQLELPDSLLVYWYRDQPELAVGERWRLELQLRPPWGRINFQGTDRERWLFAEGLGGLGTVRAGELLARPAGAQYSLQRLRSRIQESVISLVENQRARGVLQALSIADRNGLSFSDRQLLISTGTSHLLAISGLHVGLAAVGGAWLGRLLLILLPFAPFRLLGLRTSLGCGLFVALAYAALAGWGVSTQRAVLMLAVVVVALLLNRAVSPARVYLLALCVVLVIDPLAPLGVGFWFSFLAVAVLLLVFAPRTGRIAWWKSVLLAQAGIMLAMLPASAYWFQLFSPLSFLANIVAIPWVSLAVVPPVLAGVAMLAVSSEIAGILLGLAGKASLALFAVLEFLSQLQGTLPVLPPPGILAMLLASIGGLLMLLPRGMPCRWMGPFLILPLFLPANSRTDSGSLLVEILDVGQGTAVLLSTPERTLLYDSGPGDGQEQNLVNTVIRPALAGLGKRAPERIVISHGDLDHAGGIKTLAGHYPQAQWNINLPQQRWGYEPCRSGLNWNWSGFEFEALHPSGGLPYLGNDSSCVLGIKGKQSSVLLTGDISSAVEHRLTGITLGSYRLLLVPHHGSATSSSREFIATVRPELAVATTGLGNRFGFPRKEVTERYIAAGAEFWSSGDCGAIRIRLAADGGIQAESARRKRKRIWRWPAARECP